MISQIFANMHMTLQKLAKHSKTPQEMVFRLAAEITKRLISHNIRYAFLIQYNTVYLEELDKIGKVIEVVVLDLSTGEYSVVDLEEYLRISWR